MVWLPDGEKLRICLAVSTARIPACDGQTHRQIAVSCHGIVRSMHTPRVVKTTMRCKKLELEDMFSRFDWIPVCVRQTFGQTDRRTVILRSCDSVYSPRYSLCITSRGKNHRSHITRQCDQYCKGDLKSMGEDEITPLTKLTPSTDSHQILHTWLRRPTCHIWSRSHQRLLLPI